MQFQRCKLYIYLHFHYFLDFQLSHNMIHIHIITPMEQKLLLLFKKEKQTSNQDQM